MYDIGGIYGGRGKPMNAKRAKFIIVFVLLLGFVFTVYFESSKWASDNEKDADSYLDEHIIETTKSRSSSILTIDELTALVAQDFGISVDEAKLDLLSMYEGLEIEMLETKQFATFTIKINVSEDYLPTLRYYAEVNYQPEKDVKSIERLLKLNFNQEDYKSAKEPYKFHGKIFTNVEDDNRIYYRVDGDFYKEGKVDSPADLNILVDENKTLDFKVENSAKQSKYINQDGIHKF